MNNTIWLNELSHQINWQSLILKLFRNDTSGEKLLWEEISTCDWPLLNV